MSLFRSCVSIVILIVISSSIALAQSRENVFELEYTYAEPSEGQFEDEIALHEGKVNALFHLSDVEDRGVGFAIGAGFQANVWEPDDSRIEEVDLYKAKIPVFLDFEVTQNWILGLNATPGIHSDFEDVDEDDFRVEGSGVITYIVNPKLRLSAGAAFGEEFGEAQAYPVGGVWWQPTSYLLLDLIFPRPRIQLSPFEKLRLFVFGEPAGGEWNVGDSDRTQVDIEQKGLRAGGGIEFGIGESSWFYVAGGVEVERELQIALNEDEVFNDEVELDDQAFVRAGFRVTR